MARYRIMAWRGIPAQICAEDDGRSRVTREMPAWFAEEIDRVAMRDGAVGTDAYLEAWAWTPWVERAGSPDEVADAVRRELLGQWGHPLPG